MASQSDKKEEFRKYLEKGKVLSVLTTVLTDLFEMEKKPEDPLQYMIQRFSETVEKNAAVNGPQADGLTSEPDMKPAPMMAALGEDRAQAPVVEMQKPDAVVAETVPAQQPPQPMQVQQAQPAPPAQQPQQPQPPQPAQQTQPPHQAAVEAQAGQEAAPAAAPIAANVNPVQ